MARRTVFLGSALATPIDTRGPVRPSWPDLDATGSVLDAGTAGALASAVAIALAGETDWDIARVSYSGGEPPDLLLPGRVLFVPAGQKIAKVEPVFAAPSTRLYDATQSKNQVFAPTKLPPGVIITATIPGDPTTGFHLDTSSPSLAIATWFGGVFASAIDTWTPNSSLTVDSTNISLDVDAANLGDASLRPSDISFDGGVFTLADYVEAGLIPGANKGVSRVSGSAIDSHGNPGDPTAGTIQRYARYFSGGQLATFGGLSSLFFGRLALDVFDSFPVAELGGHPYRPRLAPARFVTFGAITVPHKSLAADQPLLTFPVCNAKAVEFVCRNNGANNLYAVVVSPLAEDAITGVGGVPSADPLPAVQFATITPGQEGSVTLDVSPAHPLAKILIGAAVGGTAIAAGATLTVKREVIE